MKVKSIVISTFFLALHVSAFAQNSAGLKSLLNKNADFIFPQTPEKIAAALHTKTIYYEDANEDQYAKWLTKSGLELYTSLGENNRIEEMYFDIADDKTIVVEDLPFHLALNKTTLKESMSKFSQYAAKKEDLSDGSTYPGGSKLTFKKGDRYATLLFDSKQLLRFLSITTALIDPAVN